MKRREFLQAGLAGVTSLAALHSRAFAAANDDPLRVALVGCGWYGKTDLFHLIQVEPVEVVGLCDVDRHMVDEAAELVAQRQASKKRPTTYGDYRKLLADQKPDVVLIGTPDHWHCLPAIAAAKAGKDVYCEKPISLTVYEARELARAFRRYGRIFQTGTQQRSAREFRFACELVHNGYIGELKHVTVNVGGPPSVCNLPAEGEPPEWLDYGGPV